MAEPQPQPQQANDSLGLDLNSLKVSENSNDDVPTEQPAAEEKEAPATPAAASPADAAQPTEAGPEQSAAGDDKKQPQRERKKPYVNHERVKTGGTQRDKLTEEELAERMARIREQNEKIKQRRLDVEQDELEFKKTQEAERAKVAKNKKVQENVDRAREQNARRKLDKIQSREWDSGKPGVKKTNNDTPVSPAHAPPTEGASIGIRGGVRGGGGRGRGRGRGGPPPASRAGAEKSADKSTEKPVEQPVETPAEKSEEHPVTAAVTS